MQHIFCVVLLLSSRSARLLEVPKFCTHCQSSRQTPVGRLPSVCAYRYLLKLRAEVEVMQQLGVSLNAVHLHDVFEDDVNVHMVMELCEGGALLERVESGVYSEKYISRLVRSILRFIAQCHAKVTG